MKCSKHPRRDQIQSISDSLEINQERVLWGILISERMAIQSACMMWSRGQSEYRLKTKIKNGTLHIKKVVKE